VITISTYTEPAPVIIAPEEPQKTRESEENSESSPFAELLAGLLNAGNEEILVEQPVIFFENEELLGEVLSFDDVQAAGNFMERELFEIGLSKEHPQLLSDLDNQDFEFDFQDGLLQNLSNVENDNGLADLWRNTEVSTPVVAEESDSASQNAVQQLVQNQMEGTVNITPAGEEAALTGSIKKNRLFSENEKTDSPAVKDARNEETASLHAVQEKEKSGRLDEIRSRSRRDRVTFEVRDLRTGSGTDGQAAFGTRINAGAETRVSGEIPVREITLDLRFTGQGQGIQNPAQAQTSWEAKAGNALENMLARELHQSFNGDIVRHASMALKDGGEGTIRIALKPESLGNVKIRLEMTENKITGHIVVESEEALNAFRKEIASLEQAFRDSGYANADLNLSLAAEGRNAEWSGQEANSPLPHNAALRYDDSSRNGEQDTLLVDVFFRRTPGSINLLA
jgi:flagellar hook-length control protein FliK